MPVFTCRAGRDEEATVWTLKGVGGQGEGMSMEGMPGETAQSSESFWLGMGVLMVRERCRKGEGQGKGLEPCAAPPGDK